MSKYHVTIRQQRKSKFFKMTERSDGCNGETLLVPCAGKHRLQRKLAKDYYWVCVLPCSVRTEVIIIPLLGCLCLKDQSDLCSINCHTHAMVVNCPAKYSKFLNGWHFSSAVNMSTRHLHVTGGITWSFIGLAQVESCRHPTNLSSFER